ncbi:Organic cation transporter, partial [Operophtera brumata]
MICEQSKYEQTFTEAPLRMEETKKEINLDSVLESLGPHGKYNLLNFVLLLYPILLSSFFECEVAGCEQRFNDTSWLKYAIPTDVEKDRPASCERYASVNNSTVEQCVAAEFSNTTISCDSYFNLGCQEWKRALVGTIHNSGMFLAMLFTGAISDRFGRKWAVGFASAASFIFGFARAFAPVVELVGLKQRVIVSAMCNMTFVIGVVLIALLAWCVENWRTYILILYCPATVVVVYVWFMNESARWLLSKGRRDEAITVLKKAAKINHLDPRVLDLDALGDPLLKPENQTTDKKSQFYKAVRSSIIWKRLMICSFLWMTCSLVYYGLSINAVSLSSNKYVSFMLVTLVEIPAYIVVVIVLDKYGRKKTLVTTYVLCATMSLLFAFLPRCEYRLVCTADYWSIPLYLVGKWSVTLAYSSVYIYVSE